MKKSTLILALLLWLAIPAILTAQDDIKTENTIKPVPTESGFVENKSGKEKRTGLTLKNNISVHIGVFDPWFGVSYERLISPFWGFDAALGLIGGSIGTKVYLPRLSEGKISFYTGISEGVLLMVGAKHYIPIGLTYIGKKGFRISFDMGPQIYYDKNEENMIGLTLKIGKSF